MKKNGILVFLSLFLFFFAVLTTGNFIVKQTFSFFKNSGVKTAVVIEKPADTVLVPIVVPNGPTYDIALNSTKKKGKSPKGTSLVSFSPQTKLSAPISYSSPVKLSRADEAEIKAHIKNSLKKIPRIVEKYGFFIKTLSKTCEMNSLLITADVGIESMGYYFAVSNCGAIGLKQIMPKTAQNHYFYSYLKTYSEVIKKMRADGIINDSQYKKLVVSNDWRRILKNIPEKYVDEAFTRLAARGNIVDSAIVARLFHPFFNLYIGANYMQYCSIYKDTVFNESDGIRGYYCGPASKLKMKKDGEVYHRKVVGLMDAIVREYPDLLPEIGVEVEEVEKDDLPIIAVAAVSAEAGAVSSKRSDLKLPMETMIRVDKMFSTMSDSIENKSDSATLKLLDFGDVFK